MAKPQRVGRASLDSLVQAEIKKLVRLSTFVPAHRYSLDTGSPELNAALGAERTGIPYGKLIELRGVPHGGKTTISLVLAGMAQQDGAAVGYIDPEQSRDSEWAEKFGVIWRDVVQIYPKLISRKNRPPRLEGAEELFAEAEAAMSKIAALGYKKQFWLLDSVAMLRTRRAIIGTKKEQKKGGMVDRNMNAAMDRAAFLAEKLPEWAGLAASYNATVILINHEKRKPGVVWGSPLYSPGGDAMQHACAVRARVARIKHGRLRKVGGVVGLVGLVTNFKNKAGAGSVQDREAAFRIRFDRSPARVRFMSREDGEALL